MNHVKDFIRNMILATTFTMEKPTLYGGFHLSFLIIGLFVITISAYLLRKANERTNKIVLLSCSIFLIIAEVYKHLFHLIVFDYRYKWDIVPLQLCSMPMYLCLIVPFLKSEASKKAIYTFLATYNTLGGIVTMLNPETISHEYVTLNIHSYTWHLLLIFIGLYLIFSGRAGVKRKDFLNAVAFAASLFSIALIINVLFSEASDGILNLFFIGPTPPPVPDMFKPLIEVIPWYFISIVYFAIVTLGAYIIFALYRSRKDQSLKQ